MDKMPCPSCGKLVYKTVHTCRYCHADLFPSMKPDMPVPEKTSETNLFGSQKRFYCFIVLICLICIALSSLLIVVIVGNSYESKLQAAMDESYSTGRNLGYQEGQESGYNSGYRSGYETGFSEAQEASYEQAKSEGYDSGYKDGKEEGYNSGFSDGQAAAISSSSNRSSSSSSSSSSSQKTPSTGVGEVYVSRNGKIHTRSDCSGMKYYTAMSYEAAVNAGYDHCGKCYR